MSTIIANVLIYNTERAYTKEIGAATLADVGNVATFIALDLARTITRLRSTSLLEGSWSKCAHVLEAVNKDICVPRLR